MNAEQVECVSVVFVNALEDNLDLARDRPRLRQLGEGQEEYLRLAEPFDRARIALRIDSRLEESVPTTVDGQAHTLTIARAKIENKNPSRGSFAPRRPLPSRPTHARRRSNG